MTAEVHCLDGVRVSARAVIPERSVTWERITEALKGLTRQVEREAASLGPHRRKLVYITYEEVVDAPNLDPVA